MQRELTNKQLLNIVIPCFIIVVGLFGILFEIYFTDKKFPTWEFALFGPIFYGFGFIVGCETVWRSKE